MADRWLIRDARLADLPELVEAERVCFSDPWSESSLEALFENSTAMALVARRSGLNSRLAGYVFARAIAGEGEILNIAVIPGQRTQGLGGLLLDEVIGRLRAKGVRDLFLEVRESNEAARRLYGARGFRPIGLRADYYRKPREHALVLGLSLKPA